MEITQLSQDLKEILQLLAKIQGNLVNYAAGGGHCKTFEDDMNFVISL